MLTLALPRGAGAVTVTFRAGYEGCCLSAFASPACNWWHGGMNPVCPPLRGPWERVPHHLTAVLSAARNRAL